MNPVQNEAQRAFGEDTTAATREMPEFASIYCTLENDNDKCQAKKAFYYNDK